MRADIGRCPAPCELQAADGTGGVIRGDAGCSVEDVYDEAVQGVRAFLAGNTAEVVMQLADDMERASADLKFEHAAAFRDWIALLDRLVEKTGAVAPAVEGPDRLVVRRSAPDATAVLIRRGTVVGVESIHDPDDANEVAGRIGALFSDDIEPAPGLDRTSADARRIVDQWIGRYRESIMEYERRRDEPVSDFAFLVAGEIRPPSASPEKQAAS